MQESTHQHIDARDLLCPVPLMMLKTTMADLPSGAVVTIEVTDEHAELDFEIWCERFGHTLHKRSAANGVMCFQISKAGP